VAVKKTELYRSLWASCDKLRGGMDASQYKDYILTLLFVKYVSDRFKGKKFADVDIPKGGSFDDMVSLIGNKNIGEEMDKVIGCLADTNGLRGIIDNAHFNDETKLGKGQEMVDKLSDLVAIFRRPELDFKSNRANGDDIIGDAYEYLMRNFATESGKSKGQFYTPAEVSRILAKVIDIDQVTNHNATVYDPACGSGSLLIRAADEAPFRVAIYGQEKDLATAGLARMNLVLHNKADGEIAGNHSTFSDPHYFENDEEQTTLRRFDFVVANPPFSTKNWTDGFKDLGRFDDYDSRPPEKNGDYAWLLHILKSLKPAGKAAVILPHGVLFRGNAEAAIRKNIIDRGYIKGIIGLPANLFYGTGIPACIIVINKTGAAERSGIFMIDASHDFVKDGNKNRLRERDIYKIVTTFRQQITENKYSRFVPISEICGKNDYNLNIPRYIDSSEREDLQSIEAHLHGGIPDYDVDGMAPYWNIFDNLKSTLFTPLRDGYYQSAINKDEVRHTVYADPQFSRYAEKVVSAFEKWKKRVNDSLRNINGTTQTKKLIASLAEAILEEFKKVALIDKYDVYQALLAYWQDVMADDVFIIIQDGYQAARSIENIITATEKKKKDGAKETKEKITGWEGKLIPRSIIVEAFFHDAQKEIDEIEMLASKKQAEMDALIESAEEAEEGSVIHDVLKDSGSLDVPALTARLKDESLDAEDRVALENLREKKKQFDEYKKTLKTLQDILEQNTKKQYPKLTDAEILELLVNKKWYHTIYQGIDALYTAISHNIANRVAELAGRYEETLPQITDEVAKYEEKVKSHLERMGFVW
jgi:type I restriction enzyme M protein